MRQNQLDRLAALRLLFRHHLLKPSAESLFQPQLGSSPSDYRLTVTGKELVERLAQACDIVLIPAVSESPLLQGSRATFKPFYEDAPEAGGEVCFDMTLDEKEQAFSIAHELGHFMLHLGQPTRCKHQDMENEVGEDAPLEGQVEVYNPKNRREQEANLFALELLMPSPHIQAEYLALAQSRAAVRPGEFSPGLVEKLAQKFKTDPYRLFFQLGNVFLDTPLPLELALTEAILENKKEQIILDNDQATARIIETPALVLAGPGAGKTRTLVERVRFLVEEKEVNPARLLVLTFSNKAAGELRERLTLAGLAAEEMAISTFHAYGVDLLRRHAERASLERDFRLLDSAHAFMLLQDILVYLPVGYYVRDENPELYLNELLIDIGRAKDYLRTPADYDAAIDRMVRATDNQGLPKFKSEDVEKARNRAGVYRVYEEQKKLRKQVDFGDLVMLPVQLMRQDSQVLAEERSRYEQILVDEFQDINYASGELLRLLAAPAHGGQGNIWAVGDINQSIYRFRGAFPKQAGVEAFKQDYAGNKPVDVLELSLNYRSLPSVVSLANHLRATMPQNAIQELRATRKAGNSCGTTGAESNLFDQPSLIYTEFQTGNQEKAALIAAIWANRQSGYTYADQAVLCRTNDEADEIAELLLKAGIPALRLGEFFKLPQVQEVLAVIGMLNGDVTLGLARLGGNRLPVAQLLELAGSVKLSSRQVLRNLVGNTELAATVRQFLSQTVAMLDGLANRASLGRLIAEYLFEWSDTVAGLYVQAQLNDLDSQQALLALGQLVRLGASFDREEQDRVVRAEERQLDRKLDRTERDFLIKQRLRPFQQRRNFLRYKTALVRSGTRIELESGPGNGETDREGAVQIITVHKSKGLEFPCVYLPGLYQRSARGSVLDPAPPGFHITELEGQEHDDACLFYVGVTRAKDKVFLSWAKREENNAAAENDEGDAATSKGKARTPASVLGPLQDLREVMPDLWGELEALESADTSSQGENQTVLPAQPKVSNQDIGVGAQLTEIDFYALKDYLRCPSRYFYKHALKGQISRDENKARFYEGLRQARQELDQPRLKGTGSPALETLLENYHSLWPSKGEGVAGSDPEKVAVKDVASSSEGALPLEGTAADYQRHRGAAIVEQIWQQYQSETNFTSNQPVHIEYNQASRVELKQSAITFRIDRVETMADGHLRLVRSVVRRPYKNEAELKTEDWYLPTLYALAFPNQPDRPLNEIVLETTSSQGVQQLVLSKSYSRAIGYRNWQAAKGKAVGLLGKLESAFQNLATGDFSPRPDHQCPNCPFYAVICPQMPG